MIDPQCPDFSNTPVAIGRPAFKFRPSDIKASPYVSIITPFYNTGPVFHETARSILEQSFQQWEWLIVNDATTKRASLSLLAKYRNADPRIRVIDHDRNKGPSETRNTGFRSARSNYVALVDSDDLLESTAVEKWLWFLESHPEYAFVKGYSVGFGAQQYLWKKGFHNGDDFREENLATITTMVRKAVFEAVGGFDKAATSGLEDWDFWMRCAHHGHWGGTIPEFLDWYRRRKTHSDRWASFNPSGVIDFQRKLRRQYPELWEKGLPRVQLGSHLSHAPVSDTLPCENRIHKVKPRLLMVLPWLTMGGADKFNLDTAQQLIRHGWEVSIATTLAGDLSWLPQFARHTPDIFILNHFLRLVDYPRFLRYLIQSRQIDTVLVSNSEMGYLLLPYLRAHCPGTTFVDYCHMEEEYWKNGGHPRAAVESQELLDLNIVSSHHLKNWMVQRGAEEQRIRVCYTNVDTDYWKPNPKARHVTRKELGWDNNIPLLLYAGRIVGQKQPRVFAETMLKLAQRGLSFGALVAGNGPDLPWLQQFVANHKLDTQVTLLGPVTNEQIRCLLQSADIFFLPSQWEGISLAIYEAMACGVCVVGADVGGQRELVNSKCGELIPRADEDTEVQQYTKVLASLIKNRARRERMGSAARQRVVAEFQLSAMGERMMGLLAESRHLHSTQPRPPVGIGLGRACASHAVEYPRLSQLADQLWAKYHERTSDGNGEVLAKVNPPNVSPAPYKSLVTRIKSVVNCVVPKGAKILVVSKGDDDLLGLSKHIAWHFPQNADGKYAGHYPSDSAAAEDHLEQLLAKDAQYLLFPQTAFWWFEFYEEFRIHLDSRYRRIGSDESCIIFDLTQRKTKQRASRARKVSTISR